MNLRSVKFNIQTVLDWEDWGPVCVPRLAHSSALKIPHMPQYEAHPGVCVLVGAGPSLNQNDHQVALIRALKAQPLNIVMSLNGAHDWLVKRGIKPNIQVIFEYDVEDVSTSLGGEPDKDVAYYICSHCHRTIFDQLEDYRRVLWHAHYPWQRYHYFINKFFPKEFMISGGYATFFRSLTIARLLGYREFEIFGVDSSFVESSHVDGYAISNIEPKVVVWGTDPSTGEKKEFKTQGGLAFQAVEFIEFCRVNPGLRIKVHGDGLLKYLHKARYPKQYED